MEQKLENTFVQYNKVTTIFYYLIDISSFVHSPTRNNESNDEDIPKSRIQVHRQGREMHGNSIRIGEDVCKCKWVWNSL